MHTTGRHRRPVVVTRHNELDIKTRLSERRLEKALAADAVAHRSFSLGHMAGVLYAMGTLSIVLGLTGDISFGSFGPVERAAFLTMGPLAFVGRQVIKRIHNKAGLAKNLLEEKQENEHRGKQTRER